MGGRGKTTFAATPVCSVTWLFNFCAEVWHKLLGQKHSDNSSIHTTWSDAKQYPWWLESQKALETWLIHTASD